MKVRRLRVHLWPDTNQVVDAAADAQAADAQAARAAAENAADDYYLQLYY